MAQTNPSYLYATGKCEKPIIDALVQKYGASIFRGRLCCWKMTEQRHIYMNIMEKIS